MVADASSGDAGSGVGSGTGSGPGPACGDRARVATVVTLGRGKSLAQALKRRLRTVVIVFADDDVALVKASLAVYQAESGPP